MAALPVHIHTRRWIPVRPREFYQLVPDICKELASVNLRQGYLNRILFFHLIILALGRDAQPCMRVIIRPGPDDGNYITIRVSARTQDPVALRITVLILVSDSTMTL